MLLPEELESVINNMHDGIVVVGLDGTILKVNDALAQMFGIPKDRIIGKKRDLLQAEGYDVLNRILAGHKVSGIELVRRHSSGKPVYIRVSLSPVVDKDGQLSAVSAIVQDITEKKTIEEDLRSTKELFEAIFNFTADAIAVFDLEDRIIDVNQAYVNLFGWDKEELIGTLIPGVPPHLLEQVAAEQKRVKFGEVSFAEYESEQICKNGTKLKVLVRLSPIRDNSGTVVAVSQITRDISLQKEAELAHQTIKLQLESFIHHNFDAIVLFDRQMNLVDANPAAEALYGWTKEEYRRCNAFELIVPSELIEERNQLIQNVLNGTPVIGHETQRYHKDGKLLHISLSVSPIYDSFGKVVGFSSVARDISERKRTEELLVQSEKLSIAGLLAAGIAHEIRNPLTSLKGFTRLLSEAADSAKQNYLGIMMNELSRIEQIVNELLVLAKPQAVLFTESDLSQILQDVIELLKSEANMRRIELLFEMKKATILCNSGQLKQVLVNLIKNGIEAMPGGGKLEITLTNSDELVTLELKDQGIGMTEEQLAKIGSPFYTTKDKGTGLGLMISQKIIREHQGTLSFASQVGVGTTVRITLPVFRSESLQQTCS